MTKKIRAKLDAVPDRVDIRDWIYQPQLGSLPNELVNIDKNPTILDQGNEGACTGFALAAVINYLLRLRKVKRTVSPRMIYEMARCYDEWPGEKYEGSSARGAMIGWARHGVCREMMWKKEMAGRKHFDPTIAEDALGTPGGAFYRVQHKQVRDMHAALNETGMLYITLMIHDGWGSPNGTDVIVEAGQGRTRRKLKIPTIQRIGRAENGHAVAIVGYTSQGFIIQNSWGEDWGNGGFAMLPYEDYLLHATDVWVAQLGVPVKMNLWDYTKNAETNSGIHRAAETIPITEVRQYVVDIGNNGRLSESGDYWTTEDDLKRLVTESIPERSKNWEKRRVLLYLHGGLNSERDAAKRIIAFRDVMLDNEIYPVHIMWESGFGESIKNIISDLFTDEDTRSGSIQDWVKKFRDGLADAKDRTFELTMSAPGSALWDEMKENARLATRHPDGGMKKLINCVRAAFEAAKQKKGSGKAAGEYNNWELHIIAHSAGSIFAAHAISDLADLGVPIKTLQFFAPAIRIDEFESTILPEVQRERCPLPTMYILNDKAERDDTVGIYGKSLLYLVSNAFEDKRETPILGMARFLTAAADVDGHPALVVTESPGDMYSRSLSKTHGGFDNDPATLNSALARILGGPPKRIFTDRDTTY